MRVKSGIIFCYWVILAFGISGCKHHETQVERGFYFWKSNDYTLRDEDKKYLRELHVQKLYVKLFEVGKDNVVGILPLDKSNLHFFAEPADSILSRIKIIPTVYLRNEVLLNISNAGLDSLADNIVFLSNKYYNDRIAHDPNNPQGMVFNELQIDCDWTGKTKEHYFYLLRALKQLSHKTISCTLRLYPYKYPDKMGIPPVDKAMLMCYNLINPLWNENKNSILDNNELNSYLTGKRKYPLHLDIALPVYSWMQCYQNNQFSGVIYHDNNALLSVLKPTKPLWYEVIKDTVVDNLYLRVGDKIKYEAVSAPKITEAIQLIKKHVVLGDSTTVSLFHLDAHQLKQFNHETLDSFYTDLSR